VNTPKCGKAEQATPTLPGYHWVSISEAREDIELLLSIPIAGRVIDRYAAALRVVEAAMRIRTGRPEQTLAEDADALAAALAEWGE